MKTDLLPTPTGTCKPEHDDLLLYLDTLRRLGSRGADVNAALVEAHMADTSRRRRAALTNLHTRLRGMAAVVNEALAGESDAR